VFFVPRLTTGGRIYQIGPLAGKGIDAKGLLPATRLPLRT